MWQNNNPIFILFFFSSICLGELVQSNNELLYLDIEEHTLDNGMRIFIAPDYDQPVVSYYFFINRGYLDSPNGNYELTTAMINRMHFGTKKYPTQKEMEKLFISLGNDTWFKDNLRSDNIEFWVTFLKEDSYRGLSFIADYIQNPTYKSIFNIIFKLFGIFIKDDEPEADNILNYHIKDMYYSQPGFKKGHNISTPEFSIKKMKKWHDTIIQPKSTTLVVMGDININYIKKITSELFGNWESSISLPEKIQFESNLKKDSEIKIRFIEMPKSKEAHISIMFNGFARSDSNYYAQELLNSILAGGNSSRLRQNVWSEFNEYGNIELKSNSSERAHFLKLYVNAQYSNLDLKYKSILNEIDKINKGTITNEEIDIHKLKINRKRIRDKFGSHYKFSRVLAEAVSIGENPNIFFNEEIDNFNRVSLEDVNRIAKEIFNPTNFIIAVVGNKDSSATFLNNFDNIEYFSYKDKLE